MTKFNQCSVDELNENFSKLIGKRYALITVSDENSLNMMTASWGSMGVMWNKNVVNIVVRPSRYTYNFLMNNNYFTLNFLTEGNEDIYRLCGTKSGRECDKVKETGLSPCKIDDSIYVFDESEYVFVCKKIYSQKMRKECFVDGAYGDKMYPDGDVHTQFIAEVEKIYVKMG